MTRVAAIIPAAGSGSRLGGGTPKALRLLGGRPLVQHAVESLAANPKVVQIVVAAPGDRVRELTERLAGPVSVVAGGSDRQSSVAAALLAVDPRCELILVHDAARPLVPAALVARVIDGLEAGAPAVVPGLPVVDTIKLVDDRSYVVQTPPRDRLRSIQTPQGFRREILLEAHRIGAPGATDDAALVEAAGYPVLVVAGDPAAMKITTPRDFGLAEALLAARTEAP